MTCVNSCGVCLNEETAALIVFKISCILKQIDAILKPVHLFCSVVETDKVAQVWTTFWVFRLYLFVITLHTFDESNPHHQGLILSHSSCCFLSVCQQCCQKVGKAMPFQLCSTSVQMDPGSKVSVVGLFSLCLKHLSLKHTKKWLCFNSVLPFV